MAKFNSEHKAVLDELLLGDSRIRPGKMFGFPAYYAGSKLCVCLYDQGVGVKLPQPSATELLERDSNITPFQPMGRPKMREWVQINIHRSEDLRKYKPVFDESIEFVLSLKKSKSS